MFSCEYYLNINILFCIAQIKQMILPELPTQLQLPLPLYIINLNSQYHNQSSQMLASNPFIEQSRYPFSSSSLYLSTSSNNRSYFPLHKKQSYISRPGFLATSNSQLLPSLSCRDMKSPYSSAGYTTGDGRRPKKNGEYLSNPFYRARLVSQGDYGGYQSGSLSMYQSKVTPVYTNYTNYNSQQYRYQNNDKSGYRPGNRQQQPIIDSSKPIKRKNSPTKPSQFSYQPSGYQPSSNQPSGYQPSGYQPLYPSSSSQPSGYQPVYQDPSQTLNRNQSQRSEIEKLKYISQQPEQQDDPLNYNIPSFNMKSMFKKELSNKEKDYPYFKKDSSNKEKDYSYSKLNEEYDNNMTDSQKYRKNDSFKFDEKQRQYNTHENAGQQTGRFERPENRGVQASNSIQMSMYPSTLTHQGKIFYLTNILSSK